MKICDLTQFYSPASGGVRRYVAEKRKHLRALEPDASHILIVPGDRTACFVEGRFKTYTIRSPLVSRTSRYRMLLRLDEVERILDDERPDIIESGDPYQVAWKAVYTGQALGIPVVGFYHSHFPEAYVRTVRKYLGETVTEYFMDFSRRYIRRLYNRFSRTFVPSPALRDVLASWGVRNGVHVDLGVDTSIFRPLEPSESDEEGHRLRAELEIPSHRIVLLYVGRLAQEKNTQTLFTAFRQLALAEPGRFHLLVVGDGLQRTLLERIDAELRQRCPHIPDMVSHLGYCGDSERLAQYYRLADLFVHPSVQETFGLVSIEAQACGTPVIGISGGYMDRIIHSNTARWARENSADALASAVIETVADGEKSDPNKLHARVASLFSWTQVFTKVIGIYREVIEENRRKLG